MIDKQEFARQPVGNRGEPLRSEVLRSIGKSVPKP